MPVFQTLIEENDMKGLIGVLAVLIALTGLEPAEADDHTQKPAVQKVDTAPVVTQKAAPIQKATQKAHPAQKAAPEVAACGRAFRPFRVLRVFRPLRARALKRRGCARGC